MKRVARLAWAGVFLAQMTLLGSTAMAQNNDAPETNQPSEASPLAQRADEVLAVINGDVPPEEVFADSFFAQVPVAQFNAISSQLTSQFGKAISVETLEPNEAGTRAAFSVRMERAIGKGFIGIDPASEDRINELLFRSFEPINDSAAKIEADLAALPGDVSYWFGPLDGAAPRIAGGADEQMPLGSTFKLYVLATLAREVAEGKRSWDDVVELDTASFPSGLLQSWPMGAPITLHSAASLMISISDNTATDQLIKVLGRDAVEQTVIDSGHAQPGLNQPFLATREMFLLKAGSSGRLQTYQSADEGLRRQILSGIDDETVAMTKVMETFSGNPTALDVEWFGSASDLVKLFRFMRETCDPKAFEIMAINPSMPPEARAQWAYVGYKGGSEPGVLNLTWLMTDTEGVDHALFLSWRNPDAPVEQSQLELISQRILALPE